MLKKKFNFWIKLIIIFIFSLIVNQYYGNIGTFPIESFSHYDLSYRLSQGDIPFTDYWAVSGVLIDYMQFFVLSIFGDTFQIYLFHASFLNAIIAALTFILFIKLGSETIYAFIYTLLFSLLAYTTSGTLYVDHHASLLCLASIYFFIFYLLEKKITYIILVLTLVTLGLLTKIVPSAYFLLFIMSYILYDIIFKKNNKLIKPLILFFIFTLIILLIFGFYFKISLTNFIIQYFLFPISIGADRVAANSFSIYKFISTFKEIYILLLFINILMLFKYFKNLTDIKVNRLIFLYFINFTVIGLTVHQQLTQNQEFTFFLIPLLFALLNILLVKKNFLSLKIIKITLILICILIVTKYHFRINESRRFHELTNIDLTSYQPASILDSRLNGLKWITPIYPNNPKIEIDYLTDVKKHFEKIKNEKIMVFTNYSFLSNILQYNLNTPGRWFISNGGAYPVDQNNRYFNIYQNFLKSILVRKNIKKIYFIYPVSEEEFFRYFDKNCFNFSSINKILSLYEKKDSCIL